MKFEMEFGWLQGNKISIETQDFDIISIFQEFVDFQETYGWGVEYTVVEDLDFEDEDEDDTDEEIEGEVAEAAAEAKE
jgi:Ran GTPase-activating protein (RanGAP) involved in mRNA processing and transport